VRKSFISRILLARRETLADLSQVDPRIPNALLGEKIGHRGGRRRLPDTPLDR